MDCVTIGPSSASDLKGGVTLACEKILLSKEVLRAKSWCYCIHVLKSVHAKLNWHRWWILYRQVLSLPTRGVNLVVVMGRVPEWFG